MVVVGGGAAGLHVALEAAARGARVTLVSRKSARRELELLGPGRARGGAGRRRLARSATPTIRSRPAAACAGAARSTSSPARPPAAVEQLERRGVRFDRDPDGRWRWASRAGHSARRIVHAGGSETGRAITSRLAELVAARSSDRGHGGGVGDRAVERRRSAAPGVITDAGTIAAAATVLTTGGGAALWQRTTNPWGAIGAGSVLAHAAGAELADLELCQFHPTALRLPGSEHDGALITEAVRGEGATLLDADGAPVHRRARAARPGHRGDPRPDGGRRHRPRRPRPPRARSGALPERVRDLRRRGARPRPPAGPGRARRALPDRRGAHRPRRANHPGGAAGGRRMRVHRAPRRQPAGLELAQRVLRVRHPSGRVRRPETAPAERAAGAAGVAL